MATIFKRGGRGSRGGRYYIAFFDHNGKRVVRSARTTDKSAAERIAAKLEADAALRRDGVIDPAVDAISRESQRTIETHLAEFESKLTVAGRCPKHIRRTCKIIRAFRDYCRLERPIDITADHCHRFAEKVREDGLSPNTVHAYLTTLKGFTRWLTANDKLSRDPLLRVQKPNRKTDRRLERRMLLPDEWVQLSSNTREWDEHRYGMPAAERVLLYAVAIQTGLRSNELRSLVLGSLHLDVEPPYITCKADTTKNRTFARQYIREDLAQELAAHSATVSAKQPVFQLPPARRMANMLREDLNDARQAWLDEVASDAAEQARRVQSDFLSVENHNGEVLDFHALRHTCGAWLAKAGAHPKEVQTVMRHASITLTMDTYGHVFPGQEALTVARFPEMQPSRTGKAKGESDADPASESAAHAQRTRFDSGQDGATECDDEAPSQQIEKRCKPLPHSEISETMRRSATPCEESGVGPPTQGLQITNLPHDS